MANDGGVTPALVREYFIKNGGKVKRHELFDHFRALLDQSDDQGNLKNQFGDLVNSLAFLQNIEGEKFFVLKKNKNGATPVVLRRPPRQPHQRKEKGLSLPSSMRNFRFSAAEDATGNLLLADSKSRPNSLNRQRAGLRPDSSAENLLRRNNSDTSISENGPARDSGVDTAVSSLQSESPNPSSRKGSLSRSIESDQLSQYSGDTGIYPEDDQYDIEIASYTLDGFEKSWMMSTMTGNKSEIVCHLEQEPNIVLYKDFITGTGLHWAAKHGNEDIVRILAKGGANVNAKSGYTPLHLAAMHGHIDVMNILIDEYHVDVHVRDHSGKKAKDVVKKDSPEQIKHKLKDPSATIAFQDVFKKLPNTSSDLTYVGLKSQELNESHRVKPKLRTPSFRFLKPKKFKRDRPVIEHWDSTRQERLQSTLESDEKQLYKMQRTNTGSLFPTSFYFGNPHEESLSASSAADAVDNRGKLGGSTEDMVHTREAQRERLKSRSYPESEFRNITRISEENSPELKDEHRYFPRSPSESLTSSSMVTFVEPEQSLLDTVFSSLEATESNRDVLVKEKNRGRSHSEENLSGVTSAFRDELATRLTLDRNSTVESQERSYVPNRAKSLKEDKDSLPFVSDSSSVTQFFGDELATFLTIPVKKSDPQSDKGSRVTKSKSVYGISSYDSEPLNKFAVDDERPEATQRKSFSKDSSDLVKTPVEVKPFLTYDDEYSTTLTLSDQRQKQQQQPFNQSGAIASYAKDQGILRLSNNYKQDSERVESEKHSGTKVRYVEELQEPPERTAPLFSSNVSPARPPRKKDKILKNSNETEEVLNVKNNQDIDALSEFLGNEHAARLLSSDRFSESDLRQTHRLDGENRRESVLVYSELRGKENGWDFAPDRKDKTSDSFYDRNSEPGHPSSERRTSEEINNRRSGDWSKTMSDGNARSQEIFEPQEISPGQPRERFSSNYPNGSDAVQSGSHSKHMVPEVLLDTVVRTTSPSYLEEPRSSWRSPRGELAPDRSRQEPRVLPPYRPPRFSLRDLGSQQPNNIVSSRGNSSNKARPTSRPNYTPPSIPKTIKPNYPPPSIPPKSRPNYPPPNMLPTLRPNYARILQGPDNYKPAQETSPDHPNRHSVNHLPDHYDAAKRADNQGRESDALEYEKYTVGDPSINKNRSSPREWPGARLIPEDVSKPGEGLPASNYSYSVGNISFDRRNGQDATRKSLETGNYNTKYDVSARNGPSGQSGVAKYEQKMVTTRERRSAPSYVGSGSTVARDSDSGFLVAKHIPSNVANEIQATRHGSKEDLNIVSSFLGEDMTSKWFPKSSSAPGTPESERKNMYRVTSMI